MKKILMVLTSVDEIAGEPTGYELSEASHPWKVFRDAGHVVDFASIDGGLPVPAPSQEEPDEVTEDFMADEVVNASLLKTPAIADVDPAQYDAVYLVGGHGTMVDFPSSQPLKDVLANLWNDGKIVAAVCHGPAGLLGVEIGNGLTILDARKVAGFSNAEETQIGKADAMPFSLQDALAEAGASYTCADPFEEHVVVDDRLVTGQNPASAAGVAKEVVKLLTEIVREEKAEETQAAEALRAEKDALKADDADEA